MAAALIKHEQIVTTLPKAKALRPVVERLVTLAKKGDLGVAPSGALAHARRDANQEAVRNAGPALQGPRRRLYPRAEGRLRYGDNAPLAVIEFVDRDEEARGQDSGPRPEAIYTDEG